VASYLQRRREAESGAKERVKFLHADARRTGLEGGRFDVVTMCLVAHETPQFAMRELAQEALRLLRPGGAFCVMEQDPNCEAMRRITANVVAYTAFKSTEPYLDEYLSLDLHGMLREVGFERTGEKPCTPRHRAVVAMKPGA